MFLPLHLSIPSILPLSTPLTVWVSFFPSCYTSPWMFHLLKLSFFLGLTWFILPVEPLLWITTPSFNIFLCVHVCLCVKKLLFCNSFKWRLVFFFKWEKTERIKTEELNSRSRKEKKGKKWGVKEGREEERNRNKEDLKPCPTHISTFCAFLFPSNFHFSISEPSLISYHLQYLLLLSFPLSLHLSLVPFQ